MDLFGVKCIYDEMILFCKIGEDLKVKRVSWICDAIKQNESEVEK